LASDARFLERARFRPRQVLFFRVAETEDERAVAVLVLRALPDDEERARIDHSDTLDGPILLVELGHSDLLADDAGLRVHLSRSSRALRTRLAAALERENGRRRSDGSDRDWKGVRPW